MTPRVKGNRMTDDDDLRAKIEERTPHWLSPDQQQAWVERTFAQARWEEENADDLERGEEVVL